MNYECSDKEWKRFCEKGLVFDDDRTFIYPFKKMCKKFGRSFLHYLEVAYSAKGEITDNKFREINNLTLKEFQMK